MGIAQLLHNNKLSLMGGNKAFNCDSDDIQRFQQLDYSFG